MPTSMELSVFGTSAIIGHLLVLRDEKNQSRSIEEKLVCARAEASVRLRPELMNLLRDVVREQAPDLSGTVDRLERGALPSRQEAGRLIQLLLLEVARTGFFETDESVRRGLMLEELADFFGDIDYVRIDKEERNESGSKMDAMSSRFVVTATPELQKSALRELRNIAPDLRKMRDLKNGVFLAGTDMSGSDFIQALVEADPIFIKHIMPVQAELGLTKSRDADLPAILASAVRVCALGAGESFAVQCRRIGAGYDYDAKDVEVFVGTHFESHGAVPQFSDIRIVADAGQKVISIYLFEDTGYIGFSTVKDNLNEHCDEYRVFSRHARSVSRAEFKLMEALRKFGLNLPRGRALDLGAAPGGWTKVLSDAGMSVVAVDPAELDPKAAGSPNVTHVKAKAEDYVGNGSFDLLVNDMNIDPEASAQMMVQMAPHLRPAAYALMTAKLVIRNPTRLLDNIIPILEPAYDILRVKNLFHNRLEVTLLLRKRV